MEMAFIKSFLLELAPEALHRRTIPAVAFPAHAADKSVFLCNTFYPKPKEWESWWDELRNYIDEARRIRNDSDHAGKSVPQNESSRMTDLLFEKGKIFECLKLIKQISEAPVFLISSATALSTTTVNTPPLAAGY